MTTPSLFAHRGRRISTVGLVRVGAGGRCRLSSRARGRFYAVPFRCSRALFAGDAVTVETKLHQAFAAKRVNRINHQSSTGVLLRHAGGGGGWATRHLRRRCAISTRQRTVTRLLRRRCPRSHEVRTFSEAAVARARDPGESNRSIALAKRACELDH